MKKYKFQAFLINVFTVIQNFEIFKLLGSKSIIAIAL